MVRGTEADQAVAGKGTSGSESIPDGARPPGSAIWGDPCTRILIETNLRPGARLTFTSPLANYDDGPIEFGRILLTDLEQRRPEYIVLREVTPPLPRGLAPILKLRTKRLANYERALRDIRDHVSRHYRQEIEIEGEGVYRRIEFGKP